MENTQIAEMLEEIADRLELQGGNTFRVRSYRNAARTVRGLSERLADMKAAGEDLSALANIGESTAAKIEEMVETGTCLRLEELREALPAGLVEIMRVPGVGPRKAMTLHEELDVGGLEELRKACTQQRVRELEGFGAKTEANILEALETVTAVAGRRRYDEAAEQVASLARHLDQADAVARWEVAGSFRRRQETVGDLDVLVRATDRDKAAEQIVAYEAVARVLGRGPEKVTVVLEDDLQVDFRFFEAEAFGAAFVYFTGSKAHNIALRRRAHERGWKLNEYGVFKGKRRLAGADEKAVYHRLNLTWVPPELREDRGELAAAEKDELPKLIELQDVRGDLQSHTTASDGAGSIEEMAAAAQERGYAFFAITDHSKRVTVAKGLDEDRCRRHADRIREVSAGLKNMWLMAGIEVDILKSGKLDLDENVLAELDWVVASVHYDRNLDEKAMTQRLLRAIDSGVVHCLGHPLGRMIGRREPIRLDFGKVAQACAEHRVFLEINAQPDRLDLPDTYVREARQAGVKFTLGTDAHKAEGLGLMPLAVNVARRGWLEKGDVINTLTAKQLRRVIRRD